MDNHGFHNGYQGVRRFVRLLRKPMVPESRGIIETLTGEERRGYHATGAMVRDPATDKYRRTQLFALTLDYGRKSSGMKPRSCPIGTLYRKFRLLNFRSSVPVWVDLHDVALWRLGLELSSVELYLNFCCWFALFPLP